MSLWDSITDRIRRTREERDSRDLMDDNTTTDRHLRSLRREKRVMLEEYEKRHLQAEIGEMKKMRTSRNIFGSKDPNMPAVEEHRLLRTREEHETGKKHGKQGQGYFNKYDMKGGGVL